MTAGDKLDRCFWCSNRDCAASEWEQKSLRAGWKRLCARCARQRLKNPWNALLAMRKVASEA